MESFRQGLPLVLFSLLPHEQKVSMPQVVTCQHPEELESHCASCTQLSPHADTGLAFSWPSWGLCWVYKESSSKLLVLSGVEAVSAGSGGHNSMQMAMIV